LAINTTPGNDLFKLSAIALALAFIPGILALIPLTSIRGVQDHTAKQLHAAYDNDA